MSVNEQTYLPLEDRDFFVLLRAGLWQQVTESLSSSPNWDYILQLACEQTVQGIIADGIGIYRRETQSASNRLTPLNITQEQHDKFLYASAQVFRRNTFINQKQAEFCRVLDATSSSLGEGRGGAPIPYVILKGQGVAQCYPKPMLRCSGDIDFFFTIDNYERAKERLCPLSSTFEDKPYSHECALTFDDVDVELHGAMNAGINKACDRHLQVILNKVLQEGDTRIVTLDGSNVTLPSANFDALYILIHTIRHLGSFGISLRQVIDWVMLMHKYSSEIDAVRLQHDIEAMHLQRLWLLFSSFAVNVLGVPKPTTYNLQPTARRSATLALARTYNLPPTSGTSSVLLALLAARTLTSTTSMRDVSTNVSPASTTAFVRLSSCDSSTMSSLTISYVAKSKTHSKLLFASSLADQQK